MTDKRQGTTTNGKLLLCPRFEAIKDENDIVISSIKYEGEYHPYYFVGMNVVGYFFGVTSVCFLCNDKQELTPQTMHSVTVVIDKLSVLEKESICNYYKNKLKVPTAILTSYDKCQFNEVARK